MIILCNYSDLKYYGLNELCTDQCEIERSAELLRLKYATDCTIKVKTIGVNCVNASQHNLLSHNISHMCYPNSMSCIQVKCTTF